MKTNSRSLNRLCRAFTLVELVAAMAIVSVLMLAIGSALSFSIKATSGQGMIDQTNLMNSADAADQIADDLHVAMNFSEHTANSVAFTIPDRNNNGLPEQVRYAWDGTPGHSLTRQFMPAATPVLTAANATYTPVALLPGVNSFNLSYLFRQVGPAPITDGLIASHDAATGTDVNIDANNWVCEYFVPVLPIGATTYSITRVTFGIRSNAATDGILKVRLTTADASHHPLATLEEQPLYESALSSVIEFTEVDFKNVSNQPAGTGLCLMVGGTSGTGTFATIKRESSATTLLSGAYWSSSTNGGSTWSTGVNTNCMRFYVYGTSQ